MKPGNMTFITSAWNPHVHEFVTVALLSRFCPSRVCLEVSKVKLIPNELESTQNKYEKNGHSEEKNKREIGLNVYKCPFVQLR